MTRKEYNNRDIQIETRLTSVETKLEELTSNHLPHIEAKIDRLLWFIMTSAISMVIGLAYIVIKIQ